MACSLSAGVVTGVSSTSLLLVGVTGGERGQEEQLSILPGKCQCQQQEDFHIHVPSKRERTLQNTQVTKGQNEHS